MSMIDLPQDQHCDIQIENFNFLSMHATMDEEMEVFNWADELKESLKSCASCCSASRDCDVCRSAQSKSLEFPSNPLFEETMEMQARLPSFALEAGHHLEENAEMEETENVVKVYPKRRKNSVQESPSVEISHEMLADHFHEPLEIAAAKIGIGKSTMKIVCRKLGVEKWPYTNKGMPRRRHASASKF
ncbi:hypothetical protein GUITHDRAFT_117411 [Guillardia theta CCMP2712]|uniref:RWP-RK domain-containing protein n=1 Tax=Guillardia theta (strain CCMP2712) TaxID=905079 RepID=L1IJK1_GUITC|nr:hypothetical protein GUITHDRAFT_117411 [Guillardia theta CCMP2712]EKX36411.1 hypothetical protein GUITHDRAFT_117411 [Guillardia theta CCMP2712]|eukprot:XP_005823391.1 hypothetical protein GUITHDRAFT_117411 [Guillardia theta CCMP2712]